MLIARLFASFGTSFQTSGNETPEPVQPKTFATFFIWMVLSLPTAGLEISNAEAGGAANPAANRSVHRPIAFITPFSQLLSFYRARDQAAYCLRFLSQQRRVSV